MKDRSPRLHYNSSTNFCNILVCDTVIDQAFINKRVNHNSQEIFSKYFKRSRKENEEKGNYSLKNNNSLHMIIKAIEKGHKGSKLQIATKTWTSSIFYFDNYIYHFPSYFTDYLTTV